jgi:putative oxidoreductase
MNIVQRLEVWGDAHHPKWVDIIRIGLGVFLCYKGIEFLGNMSVMLNLMKNNMSFGSFTITMLGNYIAFAHLLGGFLLILGLLTRFACLLQIPILIGAIIFINSSGDILKPFSALLLSILVLLLLIYFLIVGNGPWSFKLSPEQGDKK